MAENEMKNIDNVSQPKEYGHLTSQFNLDGVDTASSMKLWITVVLPQNIGPYKKPKSIRPFNSECFERFANQVSNDRGAGIIKIVIIIAITSIGMVITSPDIVNFKKTISKTQ